MEKITCSGSLFAGALIEAIIEEFKTLLPEVEFHVDEEHEPRDFFATVESLNNKEVDFIVWSAEDFPDLKEIEEFDFFVMNDAYVVFQKSDRRFVQLRQAFIYPVSFVGAGPGEPEWLTLEALEYLKACDVCFYDALVNRRVLDYLSEDAEVKFVGKRGDSASFDQTELNQLIFDAARQGKKVLRLKGGDAGILGRIQDETDLLIDYEMSWSVTPGITAAQALAPCTGTFLTARGVSDRVILTTARQAGGSMSQLMHFERATLVVYMGILSVRKICEQLKEANYPDDLPAMIALNLGRSSLHTVSGTLDTIADIAEEQELRPPGLIVFGDTAGLKRLPFFSPLLGRKVLLLGGSDRQTARELRFLRKCGARPIVINHLDVYLKEGRSIPLFDDVIFFTPRSVFDCQGSKGMSKWPSGVNAVAMDPETMATFECLYSSEIACSENAEPSALLRSQLSRNFFNGLSS
jgi:uroporphyrin-III C-methyltransferase